MSLSLSTYIYIYIYICTRIIRVTVTTTTYSHYHPSASPLLCGCHALQPLLSPMVGRYAPLGFQQSLNIQRFVIVNQKSLNQKSMYSYYHNYL